MHMTFCKTCINFGRVEAGEFWQKKCSFTVLFYFLLKDTNKSIESKCNTYVIFSLIQMPPPPPLAAKDPIQKLLFGLITRRMQTKI